VTLTPAGTWTVHLKTSGQPFRMTAHIQTDQTGRASRQNSRRAYFDHPDCRDYLDSGQTRDSFSTENPTRALDDGPVTRVGSQNALASNPYLTMIGG